MAMTTPYSGTVMTRSVQTAEKHKCKHYCNILCMHMHIMSKPQVTYQDIF